MADEELVEKMAESNEPNAKCWLFALHDVMSHDRFSKLVVTF